MIGQEGVQTKNRVDSEQAPNGLLNRNSASPEVQQLCLFEIWAWKLERFETHINGDCLRKLSRGTLKHRLHTRP